MENKDRAHRDLMLSVRPELTDSIFERARTIDVRKRFPDELPERVWVYEIATETDAPLFRGGELLHKGCGRVVGYFTPTKVEWAICKGLRYQLTPDQQRETGLPAEALLNYGNTRPLKLVYIADPVRLAHPLPLAFFQTVYPDGSVGTVKTGPRNYIWMRKKKAAALRPEWDISTWEGWKDEGKDSGGGEDQHTKQKDRGRGLQGCNLGTV